MKYSIVFFLFGYLTCFFIQAHSEIVPKKQVLKIGKVVADTTKTNKNFNIVATSDANKAIDSKIAKVIPIEHNTLHEDSSLTLIKSTFIDSNTNYKLTVDAYAPIPIKDFDIDITIYEKIVYRTRVDTLEVVIEKGYLDAQGEATFGLGMFLLGAILL